jgi:hypothetical protein
VVLPNYSCSRMMLSFILALISTQRLSRFSNLSIIWLHGLLIDWQLLINISQCAVLSVSTIPSKPHVYYINGTDLSNHSSCTDLGVVLSEDLSFHKNFNSIVSKARFRISILFRGFISRDHGIMRRAFIAYIRPILEYNSVVWSPSLLYLIEVLESVQRSF